MAEKIELQIVADNADYITKTKQVEDATKSMQRSVQEGEKRQKGLIEDTTDALKKYEQQRKKAYKLEDLERYNKKIAEAKQTLKEYEQAGLKVDEAQKKQVKSTNNLWSSIKKLGAAYLSVNAAIKVFKAIMASTQPTADFLKREITGFKFALDELWRSIATGETSLKNLAEGLKAARQAGREYADEQDYINDRQRELTIRESERKFELAELAKIYRNTGLAYSERAEAAEKYIQKTIEGEQEALELANLRLESELKRAREIMGIRAEADSEEAKAANAQILLNLKQNKAFEENKKAIEDYRTAVSNLAAEEAKRAEVSVSPEGVLMPSSGGPDPVLIKAYKDQIAGTSAEIVKLSDDLEKWQLVNDDVRNNIVSALTAIEDAKTRAVTSTVRANIAIEMANNEQVKDEKKSQDDRLKNLEKFIQATAQLRDEYEQAQIEQLTGVERIRAEQEFELRQVQLLEDHLKELGDLTEEHYKYLDGLRASANLRAERAVRVEQQTELDYWNDFYDEAISERMKFYDFREELDIKTAELAGELTGEKELEIQKKWIQARIDLLKSSQDPILKQEAELLELQLGLIDKELTGLKAERTIWDFIGLGDSPEAQEAIKNSIDTIKNTLDDIFAARLEDAQRTRELYDTQIAETQRALDTETRLMEEGFANNVDAKRKELEQLKVARATALKEEEKALKAQRALDTAMQISSLVTATADIIKAYAKMPIIGQILSIAAIAAMWGTFVAAKTKAAQVTKLAEGGVGTDTGMITGKRHSEGGERFTDHVEVERGEMFGVLNRRASAKYGKAFTEIVNNFNRDNLVVDRSDAVNNINIDVNGLSERLDKVEYQLIRQNEFIMSRPNVQDYPNMRIEKRGNKTRIIRK